MIRAWRGWLALLLAAGLVPAEAQAGKTYPDAIIDEKTLAVQQKAAELFERGDYERAEFIYRHELVPIGDKYAQYMIGYMYLTGKGLPQDPIRASAWYRLAAERGSPEFAGVRDELLAMFDDALLRRSDRVYADLRRRYSDLVILMEEARNDFRILARARGAERSGPLLIVRNSFDDSFDGMSIPQYYDQVRHRMRKRLEMIADLLGMEPVGEPVTARMLDEIEARVSASIETIDDRKLAQDR